MNIEQANPSDHELAERAVQGDSAALEALIRRYFAGVFALIFRLCGEAGVADELAVESFSRVGRAIRNFRGPSKFVPWLYRIAICVVADWRIRRLRPASVKRLELVKGAAPTLSEESREILAALDTLSDFEREALILTAYEELTPAQVSEVLGCVGLAVNWQIYSGRRKLMRFFQRDRV